MRIAFPSIRNIPQLTQQHNTPSQSAKINPSVRPQDQRGVWGGSLDNQTVAANVRLFVYHQHTTTHHTVLHCTAPHRTARLPSCRGVVAFLLAFPSLPFPRPLN